jgi:hypothetical protein
MWQREKEIDKKRFIKIEIWSLKREKLKEKGKNINDNKINL